MRCKLAKNSKTQAVNLCLLRFCYQGSYFHSDHLSPSFFSKTKWKNNIFSPFSLSKMTCYVFCPQEINQGGFFIFIQITMILLTFWQAKIFFLEHLVILWGRAESVSMLPHVSTDLWSHNWTFDLCKGLFTQCTDEGLIKRRCCVSVATME